MQKESSEVFWRATPSPGRARSAILQICMRTWSHDTMEMRDMNHLSCQPEVQRTKSKNVLFPKPLLLAMARRGSKKKRGWMEMEVTRQLGRD